MKASHAATIPDDETSADYLEAREAEAEGRCAISDGAQRGTVTVFWCPAPLSSAPGGPAIQVRVRDDDGGTGLA